MTSTIQKSANLTETRSTSVLAVGPWNRGEFALSRGQISGDTHWTVTPDLETASELLASSALAPDFILLAQPLPGTLRQDEIEQIRRLAPLAQIVVVAGTWCEGELRTGKPPAGAMRLYWYELGPWWQTDQHSASWSHGLDGMLSRRGGGNSVEFDVSGLAAIHSHSLSAFEAISTFLTTQGIESFWCRDLAQLPAKFSIGIWVGGQLDPEELAGLKTFAGAIQQRSGSLVVLLDFPRQEHYQQLLEIGCTTILAKPYIVGELTAACKLVENSSPIV
jgi:hypothetical protein